ncbi:MAG: dephospho-CoA kinase [Bacteroidales bacterium]|nr:dephospho-CoA kinase [Bacteroidales bacterium]
MIKVGLTGGIGSGKSTVAKVFKALNVPVYHADEEAKRLMEEQDELKEAIIRLFGPDVYLGNKLNRPYLASLVFGNFDNLENLNSLVHPAVRMDFNYWAARQKNRYVIEEAAILFESGHFREFDYTIVVNAGENLRLRRVMERDSVSEDEVYQRISHQMPQKFKMILGDFLISNNEEDLILPQVLELHNKFISLHQG